MNANVTVARALTARVSRRIIQLASIIALVVFIVIFLGIWALAFFFTNWWWVLLLPLAIIAIMFLVLRFVLLFISSRFYNHPLTKQQKKGLDDFIGKIQQLIEARSTPPIFFVMVSVKDILIHRDITTIKKLIKDSARLRADYQNLERLF